MDRRAVGCLFNPVRRRGWLRDAPAVLAISALALPVVLPAAVFAVAGRPVYRVVEGAVTLFETGSLPRVPHGRQRLQSKPAAFAHRRTNIAEGGR
ncbi:hypothetical protein [Amycolatopsis taiwanensis]|uniref:hypothetical protein n=1 Tax=Amycolatopsis taiwanensis TaxID=342230 RepID=UPI002556FB7D|nr:hypothetical protein [Amycolatopsis taiwanensis]